MDGVAPALAHLPSVMISAGEPVAVTRAKERLMYSTLLYRIMGMKRVRRGADGPCV